MDELLLFYIDFTPLLAARSQTLRSSHTMANVVSSSTDIVLYFMAMRVALKEVAWYESGANSESRLGEIQLGFNQQTTTTRLLMTINKVT